MKERKIDPRYVWSLISSGKGCLYDLRPLEIRIETGIVPGSVAVNWQELESILISQVKKPVYLLCEVGYQSKQYVQRSKKSGVYCVAGGFDAWYFADLPIDYLQADQIALRYDRQCQLPGWGMAGQQKIETAHICVIGAGGLGVPVLQYLVAAGVGRIKLVDDDSVSFSNLSRQVIYTGADVGLPKVDVAQKWAMNHNPHSCVTPLMYRFDENTADELLQDINVVVDCSDNIATRKIISIKCQKLKIPWVFAAVTDYELQLSVFDPRQPNAPCWFCLFGDDASDDISCSQRGVLGMVPGIAGMMQATEVIKLILSIGKPLVGQLRVDNMLTGWSKVLKYDRNNLCQYH